MPPGDPDKLVITSGGVIGVPDEGNGANSVLTSKLDEYLAVPIPFVILTSSIYPLKISLP